MSEVVSEVVLEVVSEVLLEVVSEALLEVLLEVVPEVVSEVVPEVVLRRCSLQRLCPLGLPSQFGLLSGESQSWFSRKQPAL